MSKTQSHTTGRDEQMKDALRDLAHIRTWLYATDAPSPLMVRIDSVRDYVKSSQSPAAEAVVVAPEGMMRPTAEMNAAIDQCIDEMFRPNQPAAIEPVAAQAMTTEIQRIAQMADAAVFADKADMRNIMESIAEDLTRLASQPSQPAAGAQGDAIAICDLMIATSPRKQYREAAAMIKARLASAQPIEQKPVAWRFPKSGNDGKEFYYFDSIPENANRKDLMQPLYTAPQQSTAIDVRDAEFEPCSNGVFWQENGMQCSRVGLSFEEAMRFATKLAIPGASIEPVYRAKSSPPATEAGEHR
jgi:hypothetical protein